MACDYASSESRSGGSLQRREIKPLKDLQGPVQYLHQAELALKGLWHREEAIREFGFGFGLVWSSDLVGETVSHHW